MVFLKLKSRGRDVEAVQKMLGVYSDGKFGKQTEKAVKIFQAQHNLKADGIVGNTTFEMLKTKTELFSEYHVEKKEYSEKHSTKDYAFIHHTAGWENPYRVIDGWKNDNSMVCTEFVIGGQRVVNSNKEFDGLMLQAFPTGHYGWHLGRNGNAKMHKNSVGIELCNFGQLEHGKTYTGRSADKSQIIELKEEFRGYKQYHKYSEEQILKLRKTLLFIAERDGVDIKSGLPKMIKTWGAKAFEFNQEAFYGRIKGVWSHTNIRTDKFDCSPQPLLMDMLTEL